MLPERTLFSHTLNPHYIPVSAPFPDRAMFHVYGDLETKDKNISDRDCSLAYERFTRLKRTNLLAKQGLECQVIVNQEEYVVNQIKTEIQDSELRSRKLEGWVENQGLWMTTRRPTKASEIVTKDSAASDVTNWLRHKLNETESRRRVVPSSQIARKTRKKACGDADDMNGFIVNDSDDAGSDDEGSGSARLLVLYGKPGTGKSSAVYAAADELDAEVFEVNPMDIRNSKAMLARYGGMADSHLVNSVRSRSLILLDEADILYTDDASFWKGVEKVMETTRRPVIATCERLTVPISGAAFLHFEYASSKSTRKKLQKVLGWPVKRLARGLDFRANLNQAQFQGPDSPSSSSEGYHENFDGNNGFAVPSSIDAALKEFEIASDGDVLQSHSHTAFATSLAEEYLDDRILGLSELVSLPEPVPAYDFELRVWPELVAESTRLFPEVDRGLCDSLFELPLFGSHVNYLMDSATSAICVMDYLPYVRAMVSGGGQKRRGRGYFGVDLTRVLDEVPGYWLEPIT